jgi:hypothetical protein
MNRLKLPAAMRARELKDASAYQLSFRNWTPERQWADHLERRSKNCGLIKIEGQVEREPETNLSDRASSREL